LSFCLPDAYGKKDGEGQDPWRVTLYFFTIFRCCNHFKRFIFFFSRRASSVEECALTWPSLYFSRTWSGRCLTHIRTAFYGWTGLLAKAPPSFPLLHERPAAYKSRSGVLSPAPPKTSRSLPPFFCLRFFPLDRGQRRDWAFETGRSLLFIPLPFGLLFFCLRKRADGRVGPLPGFPATPCILPRLILPF